MAACPFPSTLRCRSTGPLPSVFSPVGVRVSLLKGLANESRLMILCVLAEGERSVSDLNTIVPLSQSALSQQLARLRQQGLVKTRRESQTIYYSLEHGPADRVITLLHDIYCGHDECQPQD